MQDCCSEAGTHKNIPRTQPCPVNGRACRQVQIRTMFHHLQAPWKAGIVEQGYYFCADPDCEVVYFGQDGAIFKQSALRTRVGIKENKAESLVCYCFGVTRGEAEQDDSAREFVEQKTGESMCSCITSNPSGRCCLADFPGKS